MPAKAPGMMAVGDWTRRLGCNPHGNNIYGIEGRDTSMSACATREADRMTTSRSYPDFKRYLMEGEHWREARRVNGEASVFTGLALHRSAGGEDGQEGAHQFSGRFLEHLEQSLVDDRVELDKWNARARSERVKAAIAAVALDRPEEIEALRFYLVPQGRRGLSVVQMADQLSLSHDALRYAAIKGVGLVWDELGGRW